PDGMNRPVMVAGGLTPDNVFDAVIATLPWVVDAVSGVEAGPGVKDGGRMRAFVQEVRRADCHVGPAVEAGTPAGDRASGLAAGGR
ncbi:MAG: hypothetical protein ACR2J7_09785, partial [Luteimonas sp.]